MMPQPPAPGRPDEPVDRSGTLIETEEDVRQAMLSTPKGPPPTTASLFAGTAPPAAAPLPAAAPPRPAAETQPRPVVDRPAIPFRPMVRPPTPLLIVFDDGRMDGEVIRIRQPRFIIGRTEGDLRLPMDGRISARHVEISHQYADGLHRWVVSDLQSTHGMFVRVSKTMLADKAEILVGSGRYRFEMPQHEPAPPADAAPEAFDRGSTVAWDDGPGQARPPVLAELIGPENGERISLVKDEYWIGSDPSCPICRPDDPFCEPRHVRLSRKPQRGWHVEHNKTVNGLWLRMTQIAVEPMVHFQIGEQRFQIKLL